MAIIKHSTAPMELVKQDEAPEWMLAAKSKTEEKEAEPELETQEEKSNGDQKNC